MPSHVDDDIRDIRVGQMLGVPAPLVRTRVATHWIATALILMEAEHIMHDRERKKR